jgi:hypothetical protein
MIRSNGETKPLYMLSLAEILKIRLSGTNLWRGLRLETALDP